MKIDIQVDEGNITESLAGLSGQMRFAMSKALNTTATDAQRAIQDSLTAHFTLRRPDFIKRTIKRNKDDFATKENLVASVRVDPDRDFLAKFEENSEKVPTHGRKVIAIPTEAVRRTKASIIASQDRPARIMATRNTEAGRAFIIGNAMYRVLGRGKRAVLQRVYTLKPRVGIRQRLGFVETANAAVSRTWEQNVSDAIAHVLSTLRL